MRDRQDVGGNECITVGTDKGTERRAKAARIDGLWKGLGGISGAQ